MRRTAAAAALLALVAWSCRTGPGLVAPPPDEPPEIVLRDVAVLDVASGERRSGLDVVVRGERLAEIVATGTHRAAPGARVIQGAGATLLPGLVDLHAHPGTSPARSGTDALPDPAANLRAYLYCGVTTVVDLGGLSPRAFARRRAVREGELLGPTLYVVGPVVTAPGGHPVPFLERLLPWWLRWYAVPRFALQVETPEEAEAAALELADRDADLLKVIVDRIPPEAPRLSDAALQAAVRTASRRGLRSIAHIGTTADAARAARAGVAAWAHVVYRERIPDARIDELAGYGIPMVPTIVVFEALSRRGAATRRTTRLERETVAPEVLAAFEAPADDSEEEAAFADSARFLAGQRQHWRDNVRRLHEAGVTILAGSDMQSGVFPGAGLHRELGHLRESGLSNLEVLRAATLDAARFLEARDDPSFGRVAVGKRADLLLVDGDPREDLQHLERIRAVLVRGLPVERRGLAP